MKNFIFGILIIILSSGFAFADDAEQMPPLYQSKQEKVEASLTQIIEAAKYFDATYPENKINDDMSKDIIKYFPDIEEQDVYTVQGYIRNGLEFYRFVKKAYDEYVEKLLTPEEPPLIVDDDQYAVISPTNGYIAPQNPNDVIVISDIKTVVPYSRDSRDIDAFAAKVQHDGIKSNTQGNFDEMMYILSRLEWKKLPFYGIIYPNPLTGNKGIGKWESKNKISARIITQKTGVKDISSTRGVIQIVFPNDKMIIGTNGRYHKPQVDFAKSKNLKNWSISFPMPQRLNDVKNNDWSVYLGELAIPVKFDIENSEQPLELEAEVKIDVCDSQQQCYTETLQPKLVVDSEYSRESSVATYINQNHANIPSDNSDKLSIERVSIKSLPNQDDYLEVILQSTEKVSDFGIFIDSPDNIAFEAPRIQIDGKKIIARFLLIDNQTQIRERPFELKTVLNKKNLINFTIMPEEFDNSIVTERPSLSFKFIFLAFVGGFLLNLMPCVFPVLSIKLLSLTKFGARQTINIRRNFYYTILGILLSMLGLASFLAMLKYLGHSIGWGMQFQNPYFVIIMIFAVLVFLLAIYDVVNISVPNKVQRIINSQSPDSFNYFLTGTLVVLMSTPCTAPYLATAIGFALAGSISEIFIILIAVAMGLAVPYLLIYLCPWLINLVPAPGAWMQKLNNIMSFMLFITIVWLFSIIYAQTDFWFVLRLGGYVIAAALLLWINSVFAEIDYDDFTPQREAKVRFVFKSIFVALTSLMLVIALIDGGYAYNRHHRKVVESTVDSVNMEKINNYVKQGKTVVVAIGADWCLTCKYNNLTVLNLPSTVEVLKNKNIVFINVDWTNYNQEVLLFMEKYGRSGLPFYILFSPLVPDGVVLPEILDNRDFINMILNFTLRLKDS